MKLEEFDYELPEELIAQEPCEPRDAARLLVHDVASDATQHRRVRDLPELLRAGDLLVVNDTRVVPARVFGRRRSGGHVEFLFIEPVAGGAELWRALVNPARKLKPNELVPVDAGVQVRAVERPLGPDGRPAMEWHVELLDEGDPEASTLSLLERVGHVPLPPYIGREREDEREATDRQRYQTVYAAHPGAVAAPTAGLHFTPQLLARLEEVGIRTATVTLHVGPGTFQPVKADNIEEHAMHAERFELKAETVAAVEEARARDGRVVAVGTTSMRVLEAVAAETGHLRPAAGSTDLFLRPGSRFHVVDVLLTNFHLPRSSLLMLVAAFAGHARILRLYREAVERRYRFYSYGDAMLIRSQDRIRRHSRG